ncbi:MAG: mechanosensitive ion channel family protein [Xanthobacteraceae bacterium]
MQSYSPKFLWPALLVGASLIIFILHGRVFRHFVPDVDQNAIRQISIVAVYYSSAWLLSRMVTATMTKRRDGRRKVPKLLRELITAALFAAATIATAALLLGQSAGGALASSGLIIAVLGFAIRNVLADVLAGVALGLEAPFRIGDWVEIDGTIRGRVIEIGWRTTRLLTRSDIYMILPNSQISRQKITNYSAPRKKYQATVEIVLGYDIAIVRGKGLLARAAASIDILKGGPKPEVRAVSYDTEGVRYAVRYWVPSFVDEADFRDAILVAVDSAIRDQTAALPRRPSLVSSRAISDPGEVSSEEGMSRST